MSNYYFEQQIKLVSLTRIKLHGRLHLKVNIHRRDCLNDGMMDTDPNITMKIHKGSLEVSNCYLAEKSVEKYKINKT